MVGTSIFTSSQEATDVIPQNDFSSATPLTEITIPEISPEGSLPQTVAKPQAEAEHTTAYSVPAGAFIVNVEKKVAKAPLSLDEETLDRIHQYQLDNGIENFSTFAAFLITESCQASMRGDHDEAIRLSMAAQRAAPQLPHPYWSLGKAYWAESKTRIVRVIEMWLEGWRVGLRNFQTAVRVSGNFYFIVHLAFFLSILVFSLTLLCKYYRLFAHDIGGIISEQRSALVGHIWAIAIISFPLLIGLGPLAVAIYWLIVTAVYFSRREKQVIWTVFLLFLFLPLSFRNAASLILTQQPGILSAIDRANHSDWLDDTEDCLRSWLIDHPQDKDVLFSLALLKKKQGLYNEAEHYYETLLRIEPRNPRVLSNLANVYLGKGRLKKAEEVYQRAIAVNSGIAAIHYNLYRTYLELYKFLEAEQEEELHIARSLNRALIDQQEKIFRHGIVNRMAIDETLPFKELWDKAFFYSEQRENLAAALWSIAMGNIPFRFGLVILIVLCFTVSFLFFQSSQRRFSVGCAKCGRPLSKLKPTHSVEIPNICANCVSLFVDLKKADLKTKQKREKQVARYEKRNDFVWTILTFCLPGGGFLWSGAPWRAGVCFLIFFAFVLKAVFWNGVVHDPMELSSTTSQGAIFLFAALFLGLYWISVTLSYRHRSSLPNCIEEYRALRGMQFEGKEKKRGTTVIG